jgi:hypothetical protein
LFPFDSRTTDDPWFGFGASFLTPLDSSHVLMNQIGKT